MRGNPVVILCCLVAAIGLTSCGPSEEEIALADAREELKKRDNDLAREIAARRSLEGELEKLKSYPYQEALLAERDAQLSALEEQVRERELAIEVPRRRGDSGSTRIKGSSMVPTLTES